MPLSPGREIASTRERSPSDWNTRITSPSKWIARGSGNTPVSRSITSTSRPAAPSRFASVAPTGP